MSKAHVKGKRAQHMFNRSIKDSEMKRELLRCLIKKTFDKFDSLCCVEHWNTSSKSSLAINRLHFKTVKHAYTKK